MTSNDSTNKLSESMGHISHNASLCSGCRTCMAVCSLVHFGVVSPELSMIQITSWPLEGYRTEGTTCDQCRDPSCLSKCPCKAIHVDGSSGARVIDGTKCNGCLDCAKACLKLPSPIRHIKALNICVKCDLCGGEPKCVSLCPLHALTFCRK